MSLNILFTGGGTAGHVVPNLVLIDALKQERAIIGYVGSADGIEKTMVEAKGIAFHAVSCGKLRRYFSLKTVLAPFQIGLGMVQSFFLLWKLKPDVVFSKGGFVAFPVVVGAWLNRIPIVAHESDMSPGLANRLCFPFVNKICLTFDAAKNHFKTQDKIEVTGTPLREQLFEGIPSKGLALCGFNMDKPCLLVIGGSMGAQAINGCIRESLSQLLPTFQVIHVCGKGKMDASLDALEGYKQFEYVQDELADLFAAASLVISRSGANSLSEIVALNKPHVLIPLSARASRGDQIQNARYFQQLGISVVIQEEVLNNQTLLQAIEEVRHNEKAIVQKMKALSTQSASQHIIQIIKEQVRV
jgi:UDP-N-acetylglucosamine--N-acetylmuramyl-(pentapeptide) pyrophosphoryl-undecaprenol N-acetylglucosamine transferase